MAERTAENYAIEHAEYLAKAVEAYMQSRISLDRALEAFESDEISEGDLQPFQESVSDHWHALESGIYEFRKRAERASREAGAFGYGPNSVDPADRQELAAELRERIRQSRAVPLEHLSHGRIHMEASMAEQIASMLYPSREDKGQ